jgi:hypothetical protein
MRFKKDLKRGRKMPAVGQGDPKSCGHNDDAGRVQQERRE